MPKHKKQEYERTVKDVLKDLKALPDKLKRLEKSRHISQKTLDMRFYPAGDGGPSND